MQSILKKLLKNKLLLKKYSCFSSTEQKFKSNNDISILPFYRRMRKLRKIYTKFQKELPKSQNSNLIEFAPPSIFDSMIPFVNYWNQIDSALYENMKLLGPKKIKKIIKILSKNEFNTKLFCSYVDSKTVKLLEECLFIKRQKPYDKKDLSFLIKMNIYKFFPNDNDIIKKAFKIDNNEKLEMLLKTISISKRFALYLQIINHQPNMKHILFNSPTFLLDIEKIIETSHKTKIFKLLSIYKQLAKPIQSKYVALILQKFNKFSLENVRTLSTNKICHLIIFFECNDNSFSNKQEFYFNLNLLRKPTENDALLTIRQVKYLKKKLGQKKFSQTKFLDKEQELMVKKILKADNGPDSWDLKNIADLAKILNNEYYVFSYYKEFIAVIRERLLGRENENNLKISSILRIFKILKYLKIRFSTEYYDKFIKSSSINEFLRDYLILKTSATAIKLFLGYESLKIPYLLLTYQAIERIKAIFKNFVNLFPSLILSQTKLLESALILYRKSLKDENKVLNNTLIDLASKPNELNRILKKDVSFFLFNAIPLLKSLNNNPSLLKICENYQKSSIFTVFSQSFFKKTNTDSRPEYELLKIFESLGVSIKINHLIGPYRNDFYIEAKKLIIEYHGLQHFFLENKAEKDMMPNDIVKREVLKLLGYKYLTITCWIWKKFREEKDKELFVKNMLRSEKNFKYTMGTVRRTPDWKKL